MKKNSAIFMFFQIGPENTRDDVLLDLFHHIHKRTFFNQLRTKEQIGYIVWASPKSQSGIIGFKVEVMSPKFDPVHMDQRIEACLDLCEAELKALSVEQFQKHCNVLISKKTEKPKQLQTQTDWFWQEISSQLYQFDRVEREVEVLKTISLQELLEFFDRHIKNKRTRAKLSVRQFNKELWEIHAKRPKEYHPHEVQIQNVWQFKLQMPLWYNPRCEQHSH